MSLAGFSGALADRGGPYRTRATTLAALTIAGAAVVLTPTEYRLLASLVRHQGQVLQPGAQRPAGHLVQPAGGLPQ